MRVKLGETRINAYRVSMCCIAKIGHEHFREEFVNIEAKSECPCCGESFTLKNTSGSPIWEPDWKLSIKEDPLFTW